MQLTAEIRICLCFLVSLNSKIHVHKFTYNHYLSSNQRWRIRVFIVCLFIVFFVKAMWELLKVVDRSRRYLWWTKSRLLAEKGGGRRQKCSTPPDEGKDITLSQYIARIWQKSICMVHSKKVLYSIDERRYMIHWYINLYCQSRCCQYHLPAACEYW